MASKAGELWKSLSPSKKKVWEDKYQEEVAQYKIALAKYEQGLNPSVAAPEAETTQPVDGDAMEE